ncbi:MAG: ferrous iron transport protein A [Hyphomicrobiaceae bacterium]
MTVVEHAGSDSGLRMTTRLGDQCCGFGGTIEAIDVIDATAGFSAGEIENRLIELGFIEGASVEILHQGPIAGDPIAVKVNGTTIALRRHEAMAIVMAPGTKD